MIVTSFRGSLISSGGTSQNVLYIPTGETIEVSSALHNYLLLVTNFSAFSVVLIASLLS